MNFLLDKWRCISYLTFNKTSIFGGLFIAQMKEGNIMGSAFVKTTLAVLVALVVWEVILKNYVQGFKLTA